MKKYKFTGEQKKIGEFGNITVRRIKATTVTDTMHLLTERRQSWPKYKFIEEVILHI